MPPRKDLGSLLVDEEVLDAKDLERVRERRPLWSALIDAELATAEQIFRALSARFGVPVVSDDRLGDVTVPEPLRRILPRSEALTLGILPVDLTPDGQRATVVMIDPSDEATLAELLTRAQIPEGRALLGRREALQRAIDRCLGGGDTAVVAPLPAPRRTTGRFAPIKPAIEPPPPPPPPTPPPIPALKPVGDNDVTGTVKLDPQLQAELQKLPPRALTADPLTPLPRPRPKRPTPPSSPSDASEPIKPETPSEALRAEERLTRALIETVEALATELERHLGAAGQGSEMARLARRVARQLNLGRRAADEIGVAAQLFAVDRALRAVDGAAAADVFSELGWAASGDGGLLPVLRALTAASAGFGRAPAPGMVPLGARIVGAVADYLELGAASGSQPDLDTVSQLLRASPAGAQVVDALLRVLEAERGDITPAQPTTVPAASLLKHPKPGDDDEDMITPKPMSPLHDSDKTLRKTLPKKPKQEGKGE